MCMYTCAYGCRYVLCVYHVCAHVHTDAKCCVHTRVHVKARHSGHQASSSVALHLIFRDRVSLWTWSLPIPLDRLNHELQGSTYLPSHRERQGSTQLCSPNAAVTDMSEPSPQPLKFYFSTAGNV